MGNALTAVYNTGRAVRHSFSAAGLGRKAGAMCRRALRKGERMWSFQYSCLLYTSRCV